MKMLIFKKLILCLIINVFSWHLVISQNIIPNYSFEDYSSFPCDWTGSEGIQEYLLNWNTPTHGSSDVRSTLVPSSCYAAYALNPFWYQEPRTGHNYVGLRTYGYGYGPGHDYREYIQVQLDSVLEIGKQYTVEMYVSCAELTIFATNNLGMYFSDTAITWSSHPFNYLLTTPLNVNPQIEETSIISDTLNWVRIRGQFTATSNHSYLVIGNFRDNASTDTLIKRQTGALYAYYYIDDIAVYKKEDTATGITNSNKDQIKVFPNPASDRITIDFNCESNGSFTIYDLRKNVVKQLDLRKGIQRIDITNLTIGVYFYRIQTQEGEVNGKFIKN